jgi:hypothetical protein
MERYWERQERKQRNLDCIIEQMEEKYNNVGKNKRKNPEDEVYNLSLLYI